MVCSHHPVFICQPAARRIGYNLGMSVILHSYTFPTGQCLELAHGDLTEESLDGIVNAANAALMHGGGLAAAIVQRGGPLITRESAEWIRLQGPVSHARPAYTSGGDLPCRWVIHAVGPVWGEGDEDASLAAAIRGSLALADRLKLTSLGIPPISTGIFGFPKNRAAPIFYTTIQQYFAVTPPAALRLVRLTILDTPTLQVFAAAFTAWQAGL